MTKDEKIVFDDDFSRGDEADSGRSAGTVGDSEDAAPYATTNLPSLLGALDHVCAFCARDLK